MNPADGNVIEFRKVPIRITFEFSEDYSETVMVEMSTAQAWHDLDKYAAQNHPTDCPRCQPKPTLATQIVHVRGAEIDEQELLKALKRAQRRRGRGEIT